MASTWRPSSRLDYAGAALLVAAVFLAYRPAWHGGMLWDDDAHLTREGLRSLAGLRAIWFDVGATQQYYPLTHSAFWSFFHLWGLDPLGYHLVTIALHAISALLVVAIARRLRLPGALLAGFVFALHPIQVESVAWMTELKNTLSTVLALGATLAYLRFDARRARRDYALALVLFALALLSKTVTAVMPAAVLVILWWERGRLEWRRDARPLLPFFAFAITLGLVTAWFERTLLAARGAEFDLTVIQRVLLAGRATWFYLWSLAWPAHLSFVYPRWHLDPASPAQYVYPAGVLVTLAALWWYRSRSRGPLAIALLFCGLLFPALGFANLYPFRYAFVADHFAYLASIPVMAAACAVVMRPAQALPYAELVLALVIALPMGAITWLRAHDYRDGEALYRATLARNPECWLCYNNLASARLHGTSAELDEAVGYLNKALTLAPLSAEVHNNMGGALQRQGRLDAALAEHREAARLNPALLDAHYNIGVVLQSLGHAEEARAAYELVLGQQPGHAAAHHNLATLLAPLGHLEDARVHYEAAARLEPDLPASHQGLGATLAALGRPAEAIVEFRTVARLEPASATAHYRLALLLAANDRLLDAIPEFEAAVRCDPSSAQLHHDFGAALANAGRYGEAVGEFNETLRLQPDFPGVRETLAAIAKLR